VDVGDWMSNWQTVKAKGPDIGTALSVEMSIPSQCQEYRSMDMTDMNSQPRDKSEEGQVKTQS
jgi:hypothetical protein